MGLQDFLAQEFYRNTIADWGAAFLIVIAAAIVGRVLYWFTSTVMRRVTARTKSRLDDIVIDMIDEPLVLVVTFAGAWYGLKRLAFSDIVDFWIDRIVQALIVLAVTWLLARLLDSRYQEYLVPIAEKTESDLDDQVLPILRKSTKMVIWAMGIIVALNNAGYQVGAVLAGLGIGGLALAMAAKDTVSNIFGGFTIFTDRPFSLNDRIKVSGFDGTVKEVGIRSTRLQTLAGTMVTIPNATFSDSAVENVLLEPSRKVTLEIGLTYDMTAEKMETALATLRQITEETEGVGEGTKVAFTGFGDFAMNLLLIYYIEKAAGILATQTAVNLAVLQRLAEQGLEMAFPTQTIHTPDLARPT